jgi:hypothetical protein
MLAINAATLSPMRNNRATLWLIAASLLAILIIAAIVLTWSAPAPAPAALPNPNGYVAFLEAAASVQKNTSDFPQMSQEELRTLVEGNTNALQTARSGLGEKAQVPVEYSVPYIENHLPALAGIKLLAQAFLAEGKLAEMDHRPCDAAKSYLDAIRLGIECRRGGVLIDGLVGIAVESMGASQLQKLVATLDSKCCRALAHELETLDAQKPTWEQTLEQEHYWSRRTFPGLQYRLVELLTWNSSRAAKVKAQQRFKTQQMKTRKLLIGLAARAYESENAHRPAGISDLVPAYLKAIPQDPSTGTNFSYLP